MLGQGKGSKEQQQQRKEAEEQRTKGKTRGISENGIENGAWHNKRRKRVEDERKKRPE